MNEATTIRRTLEITLSCAAPVPARADRQGEGHLLAAEILIPVLVPIEKDSDGSHGINTEALYTALASFKREIEACAMAEAEALPQPQHRSCLDCDHTYHGGIKCPACGNASGEPMEG